MACTFLVCATHNIYIHSSCNHDYMTAICSRRTSTPKNLGSNSCSARFMLVYKTPTIVSTDLFDLEKLGDPRSTEGIRLLGMFPGFDSKNSLFGTTGKREPKVIDLGCEAGSTRRRPAFARWLGGVHVETGWLSSYFTTAEIRTDKNITSSGMSKW